jgi:hypothetical protein
MEIPSNLKPFITQEQWSRLRVGNLSPEDQATVLDILNGGFEGMDPEKIDPEDVEETVDFVEGIVDDLLEEVPDLDEDELVAAEQTSDAILEEMAEE